MKHSVIQHEKNHSLTAALYLWQQKLNPANYECRISASGECAYRGADHAVVTAISRAAAAGPVISFAKDDFVAVTRSMDWRRANHELSDSDISKATICDLSADDYQTLLLAARHYLKSFTSEQRAQLGQKLADLNDWIAMDALINPGKAEAAFAWAEKNLTKLQIDRLDEPQGNH